MLVQPGIHTTTGSWTPLLSTTLVTISTCNNFNGVSVGQHQHQHQHHQTSFNACLPFSLNDP